MPPLVRALVPALCGLRLMLSQRNNTTRRFERLRHDVGTTANVVEAAGTICELMVVREKRALKQRRDLRRDRRDRERLMREAEQAADDPAAGGNAIENEELLTSDTDEEQRASAAL